MRGTGLRKRFDPPHGGITPACAGNSDVLFSYNINSRDHPRVCGEQMGGGWLAWILLGSPPRVRGTAQMQDFNADNQRITPACAGNRALT